MSVYDIPFLNVSVSSSNIFDEAKRIACHVKSSWNAGDIVCELFKEGCTNKLVACKMCCNGLREVVLVRVYGEGSGLLIDRDQEKLSMFVLHNLGCAPPLYCSFQNGLAYGYAPGVVLDNHMLYDLSVQRLVIKEMIRFHSIDMEIVQKMLGCKDIFKKSAGLFDTMKKWIDFIPPLFQLHGRWTKQSLKAEVDILEKELSQLNSPIVFCHNDLLPKNIIYDEKMRKVTFIDYEYAHPNFQAFDIGNYFCEFAGMKDIDYSLYPSQEFQMIWLKIFLQHYYEQHGKKEVKQTDIDLLYVQVNKFALASHVFWATWGVVQSCHSTLDFNYLEFSWQRLVEYEKRKEEFLSLSLPL